MPPYQNIVGNLRGGFDAMRNIANQNLNSFRRFSGLARPVQAHGRSAWGYAMSAMQGMFPQMNTYQMLRGNNNRQQGIPGNMFGGRQQRGGGMWNFPQAEQFINHAVQPFMNRQVQPQIQGQPQAQGGQPFTPTAYQPFAQNRQQNNVNAAGQQMNFDSMTGPELVKIFRQEITRVRPGQNVDAVVKRFSEGSVDHQRSTLRLLSFFHGQDHVTIVNGFLRAAGNNQDAATRGAFAFLDFIFDHFAAVRTYLADRTPGNLQTILAHIPEADRQIMSGFFSGLTLAEAEAMGRFIDLIAKSEAHRKERRDKEGQDAEKKQKAAGA